jgi:molecular chaperone DnaK (HSP70)
MCFGMFKKTPSHPKPTPPPKAKSLRPPKLKEADQNISRLSKKESPGTPQRQLQSGSTLVIAIDFGTTYTGVAYSHSATPTTTSAAGPLSGNEVAEKVFVIRTWPEHNQQYAEKTPTIISYCTNPPTWGGGVKPKHDQKFSKFKLALEPTTRRHYGSRDELGFWPADSGPKEPVDVSADYLTCIHNFVETFLPTTFGAEFLRNQRRVYLITVPAIWSDLAKDLTRQAAARAGIPDDTLFLVTEPEAAALYCATTCEEVDLDDGDHFLVCDAGGGTVVCITEMFR